MPLVTADSLREQVRALINDDEGIPRHKPETLTAWLELEFSDLLSAAPWPSARATTTIDTVSGTSKYVLSNTVREVDHILLDDGVSRLPFQNEFQYFDGTTGGDARYTCIGYPVEVHIKPTPTAADTYTVVYYERPTLPQTETDTVDLPSELQQVLAYRVAAKCAERERDFDTAAVFQAKADRRLAETVSLLGDSVREPLTFSLPQPDWG